MSKEQARGYLQFVNDVGLAPDLARTMENLPEIGFGQPSAAARIENVSLAVTNQPPVAAADQAQTQADTPVTVSALDNDSDPDGALLPDSVTVTVPPAEGSAVANPDGTITYTPASGASGTITFRYAVRDDSGDISNEAAVSVFVGLNRPPTVDDASLAGDEDQPLSGAVVGHDADGDALLFWLVAAAAHGTLAFNADGTFTYTPARDFNGQDSFTFIANDGQADSAEGTVVIAIRPVPDAPVAQPAAAATDEDTALDGVLAGTDADGDSLTYAAAAGPAHGSVVVNADGTFTYTPEGNYFGSDGFTFTVWDGLGDSLPAAVTIAVRSVNDLPT